MVEKWIELSFERLLSDAIPGRQKTDHGGDDDSRWHFGGLYCERGPKTDRTANCDSRDHAIRLGMDRALACIEAMASKTGTPAETSPLIAPSGLPDLGPIWMSPELSEFVRLAPLGIVVGVFGTLVGAGGGAVMVPVLLVLLPHETPATITAISLATVFFNAYSGTVTYMRMGRVDYRLGVLFTLASLPGAVFGALLIRQIPRNLFDPLFGILLVSLGCFLIANPLGSAADNSWSASTSDRRTLFGSIGSAYIGVLSSLMGIGGGIIHVPFLIRVLRIPAHIATATSHFVLTFVALTATVTHFAMGEFNHGLAPTMYLAVGVMMGAPAGAVISTRIQGSLIVRLLAVALCLVGLRLLARLFFKHLCGLRRTRRDCQSNLRFRISDLSCRIRPISKFPLR